MPLKILLADDSMTAQNMGKKILTEAGFEVITVSNGAAAVKKVTETHPDILVLDVYMPGYSGLEVCEKVKASLDTAKTPVLLTVGKMEPFRAEDGMRVKADGVIIKPFEATDLIAVIKKLADRIAPPAPVLEEGAALTLPAVDSHHWADSASEPSSEAPVPPKVDVPEEMAVTPAMGLELDDNFSVSEPRPNPEPHDFHVAAPPPPPPPHQVENVGGFQIAPPPPPPPLHTDLIPMEAAAPPEQETGSVSTEPELEQFTRFTGEIAAAPAPELELTAAAPQDISAEPVPELEPTIGSVETPVTTDPLLASAIEQQEMTTKFGVENPEESAVGVTPEIAAGEPASLSDIDDFEARLAAAMEAYETSAEESAAEATSGQSVSADASGVPPAVETAVAQTEPEFTQPQESATESQGVTPPGLDPSIPTMPLKAQPFDEEMERVFRAATIEIPDSFPRASAAAASAGVPTEMQEAATPPTAPLGRTSFDDELSAVMERASEVLPSSSDPALDAAAPETTEPEQAIGAPEIEQLAETGPGIERLDDVVFKDLTSDQEPEVAVSESVTPSPVEAHAVIAPELTVQTADAQVDPPTVPVAGVMPATEPVEAAEESMAEPLNTAYPEGFPTPVASQSAAAAVDHQATADAIVDRVLDRMRPVIGVLVKELLRELKK